MTLCQPSAIFFAITVSVRPDGSDETGLEADPAHQFVRSEIEQHFLDRQFLVEATVNPPRRMHAKDARRHFDYVRTQHVSEMSDSIGLTTYLDDMRFVHSLLHQFAAAAQGPRTVAEGHEGTGDDERRGEFLHS